MPVLRLIASKSTVSQIYLQLNTEDSDRPEREFSFRAN